jgi:hypothetical protein
LGYWLLAFATYPPGRRAAGPRAACSTTAALVQCCRIRTARHLHRPAAAAHQLRGAAPQGVPLAKHQPPISAGRVAPYMAQLGAVPSEQRPEEEGGTPSEHPGLAATTCTDGVAAGAVSTCWPMLAQRPGGCSALGNQLRCCRLAPLTASGPEMQTLLLGVKVGLGGIGGLGLAGGGGEGGFRSPPAEQPWSLAAAGGAGRSS